MYYSRQAQAHMRKDPLQESNPLCRGNDHGPLTGHSKRRKLWKLTVEEGGGNRRYNRTSSWTLTIAHIMVNFRFLLRATYTLTRQLKVTYMCTICA